MNIEISPKEYEKYLTWDDGMLYCQLLEIDGKHDWRMPTYNELEYMAIYKKSFLEDSGLYWSSTEAFDDMMWFKYAGGYSWYNYKGNVHGYIRPIRTIIKPS